MPDHHLCDVGDIEDGGSAGYVLERDARKIGIMVIRQGGTVHTYRNACPHIGTPLDFMPGQFLDKERAFILCSTHGALFRIEDGYCVSGPCAGGSLTQVKTTIREGAVYVDSDGG